MLSHNLLSWTKELIKQYNLRPGRRLGQHFLVDGSVLSNIIRAAELPATAPVLEVGGGTGVLTLELLDHSARVVVVELDNNLVGALQKIAITTSRLKVLAGDILKLSDSDLQAALNLKPADDYWLVANLPYEISGAFLRRFLSGSWLPQVMVLLLQAEVAERLVAKPGQVSLLTLQAWLAGEVQIIKKVKPKSFYPPPRVDSAIVKFKLHTVLERAKLLQDIKEEWLWSLARAGFSSRRKYLLNNLERQLHFKKSDLSLVFQKIGLSAQARAQELNLKQWLSLARHLNE